MFSVWKTEPEVPVSCRDVAGSPHRPCSLLSGTPVFEPVGQVVQPACQRLCVYVWPGGRVTALGPSLPTRICSRTPECCDRELLKPVSWDQPPGERAFCFLPREQQTESCRSAFPVCPQLRMSGPPASGALHPLDSSHHPLLLLPSRLGGPSPHPASLLQRRGRGESRAASPGPPAWAGMGCEPRWFWEAGLLHRPPLRTAGHLPSTAVQLGPVNTHPQDCVCVCACVYVCVGPGVWVSGGLGVSFRDRCPF